ncbi:MAG: hypothetical protein IPP17_12325 [Bacteroidetes bacterium]|nr:hypothetical protein [Bacteroidota bacterium]
MKKHLDSLILLLPILIWGLSSLLLGDQFTLPNRLMLATLCTAAGAGAMLTQRKLPGVLSLVAGLGMLASVPVEHEIPKSAITLRLSEYDISGESNAPLLPISELIPENGADLISLKTNPDQANSLQAIPKSHPYIYTHCGTGRSFLSKYPILGIQEKQRLGATQVSGELQAGDTAIGFVMLDLSGAHSESEARKLIGEALAEDQNTRIALIDTGETGTRIPLEWITYTTGFARSQRPWTAFTGSFDVARDDSSQMLLYSPELRCRGFEQPISGIPTIQGTYVIGS